ncbi:MAG: shikimate kinase [Actinomycetaceae bacterium]|nr:shikimate kinase [Actinomycetaceae bacterium]
MSTHIVLVGLPASGKSKLGALIAQHFGIDFVDLDRLIETREGRSIPELFLDGESRFRDAETQALVAAIGADRKSVISTGGGIVERAKNLELLQETTVVYLNIDIDTAVRRATAKGDRPLLKDNPRQTMRELAQRRTPLYERVAQVHARVDDRPARKNATRVIELIEALEERSSNDAHDFSPC